MKEEEAGERCREIFAALSEYLDQELPADLCQELEQHIAGCPPCIEFLNHFAATIHLVRRYQPQESPGALPEADRQELLRAYEQMLALRERDQRKEV